METGHFQAQGHHMHGDSQLVGTAYGDSQLVGRQGIKGTTYGDAQLMGRQLRCL